MRPKRNVLIFAFGIRTLGRKNSRPSRAAPLTQQLVRLFLRCCRKSFMPLSSSSGVSKISGRGMLLLRLLMKNMGRSSSGGLRREGLCCRGGTMLREGLLARGRLRRGGLEGTGGDDHSLSVSFRTLVSPAPPPSGLGKSSDPVGPDSLSPCFCCRSQLSSSIVIFIGPSRVYSTTFPTV